MRGRKRARSRPAPPTDSPEPAAAPVAMPPPVTPTEPPVVKRAFDEMAIEQLPPGIWRRRWGIVRLSLLFCAGNVQAILVYVVVYGIKDNAILVQFGLALIFAATGVVGTYCFGVVQDDKSVRDAIANIRTGSRSGPGASNAYSRWER